MMDRLRSHSYRAFVGKGGESHYFCIACFDGEAYLGSVRDGRAVARVV